MMGRWAGVPGRWLGLCAYLLGVAHVSLMIGLVLTPFVPKKLTFRTRFGSNLGNINHQ
jgi:hypothetical protein